MKFFLPFLFLCLGSVCSAKELKIFLLTGQSNSLGAVKGSPASPELLKKYEPKRTLYWHENFGQREGVFPGASTSWEQVRPAMPRYNGNLCMGPEYGFAFMLEKNGWFKDADVAIVKASRDGGDNSHWQKNGQAYKALVQAVKNACAAVDKSAYSKVEFAALLYLQGESNAGGSVPESAARFLELLGNLAADLKPYGDTSALAAQRAVIGEHANWSGKNESDPETGNVTGGLGRDTEVQGKTSHRLMKELAASRTSLGYVPTRDLPKLTAGDNMGVHYSGKSQISIGARFAYEAARLAGKDAGAVRSGLYDASLGSPDAWMNRKMPGRNMCVWNVASSVKPSLVSGVVKLFGICVEDPAVDTVIIQRKDASGDRLVLGPGGIRLAEGKNLLLKTDVQLAGRQSWNIPGGSMVGIEPLLLAEGLNGKVLPVRLSGQAEIRVIRGEGGANAEEAARVVLKRVQGASLKCSWTLSGKVEMSLEDMAGQPLNLGRILVRDGAVLNLNGARLPAGSVVNQGGMVNP